MRSSVGKLLSADDDLRNVAKENLVIGVVKENLINGVDNKSSRRSDSKGEVLSLSGPRRNCWIEEDKLGPSKIDGEDDSKLSQGDLLNRRKLAIKQNFLVETVKRASSSRCKESITSSSASSSASAKVVTTTTPELTTTSSRRSSGRLQVKTPARNSGDSQTLENRNVNNSTCSSAASSSQRNSTRATNAAAASAVTFAKNYWLSSSFPVPRKPASSSAPTPATSLPSAKRLTSPASSPVATRSATLRPSSAAAALATVSVSSKSGSSDGWITAESPFKAPSTSITRSASRRSAGGTLHPPSSAATPPSSAKPHLSRAATPPLSRVATPPSPYTRRQRGIGVGYNSGRNSSAHINNNNSIIEIRNDSYNNNRNKDNSNNNNSSNNRSNGDSDNLVLDHGVIESDPLKKPTELDARVDVGHGTEKS